jgi:hypothetical protein
MGFFGNATLYTLTDEYLYVTSDSQERIGFGWCFAVVPSAEDTWNTGTFGTHSIRFLFSISSTFRDLMPNKTCQFSWKFQAISQTAIRPAELPSRVLSSVHLSTKFGIYWSLLLWKSSDSLPSTENVWLQRMILRPSSWVEPQPVCNSWILSSVRRCWKHGIETVLFDYAESFTSIFFLLYS